MQADGIRQIGSSFSGTLHDLAYGFREPMTIGNLYKVSFDFGAHHVWDT
jgi:hypothetical protein